MRFFFKDLNVIVSSNAGSRCPTCSVISCKLPTVRCGGVTCGITSVIHRQEVDAEKFELQQALDIVKATVEIESHTELEPQSVEEAEQLEQALSKALDAVKETKARLQKG